MRISNKSPKEILKESKKEREQMKKDLKTGLYIAFTPPAILGGIESGKLLKKIIKKFKKRKNK